MDTLPTLSDMGQATEALPRFPYNRRWTGLVILVCILGLAIDSGLLIWLAPPYTHDSPWLWAVFTFGWLILLVILILWHRISLSAVGKAVAGIVATLEIIVIVALLFVWPAVTFKCSPMTLTNGIAHYPCQMTVQGFAPSTDSGNTSVSNYQFQGLPGFPFVVLTHN